MRTGTPRGGGPPRPYPAPRILTPCSPTDPCQEAVPVKLQVERDHLADAVAWTARALPARPTAPVLAGMRLHAGADLTLSTFDYEVSAQATVPVITDEEGTILVSGRLLAEIVRSLPARPVQLVTDGPRATLKCGTATFTLLLTPAQHY